jgi:hypothetical protein
MFHYCYNLIKITRLFYLYSHFVLWGYTNFCVVLLCVFTFCISRYDVRYDFRMKTMFDQKWTVQRNWQDDKLAPLCTNKHLNKTWAILQTTGGKDEPNIVFMPFCTFSFGHCVFCSSSIYGLFGIFKLFLSYKCFIIVTI